MTTYKGDGVGPLRCRRSRVQMGTEDKKREKKKRNKIRIERNQDRKNQFSKLFIFFVRRVVFMVKHYTHMVCLAHSVSIAQA